MNIKYKNVHLNNVKVVTQLTKAAKLKVKDDTPP